MDTWQEAFPCCLSPPSHSGWILTEEGTILLLLVFNYAALIQGSAPNMFHVTWCWPSSPLSEKQEPFVDSFSRVSIRACICSQRLETPSSHGSHKNSQAAVQQKTGMLQDFPQPSFRTFLASTTTLRGGWDGRKEQQDWELFLVLAGLRIPSDFYFQLICILTLSHSGTPWAFIDPGFTSPVLSKLMALFRTLARWKIPRSDSWDRGRGKINTCCFKTHCRKGLQRLAFEICQSDSSKTYLHDLLERFFQALPLKYSAPDTLPGGLFPFDWCFKEGIRNVRQELRHVT